MASEQGTNRTEHEFLNSWKEIASYMGRGVRTVQRYEIQYGLPIRRPAAKSRSAVMATRAEIDAWIAATPYRETYELSKVSANQRSPSVSAITTGLAKMHELRQQMLELRAETKMAMNVFMGSLDSLHRALNSSQASGQNGAIEPSPAGINGWNSSSPSVKLAKGVA